jgi:hypothetical protein
LPERCTGLSLRSRGAGFILSDDDRVAFLQVSCDYLGYPAVGETGSNKARLNLFGSSKDPDGLPLSPGTSTFATAKTLKTTLALTLAASSLAAASRLTSFATWTLPFSAGGLAAATPSLARAFGVAVS